MNDNRIKKFENPERIAELNPRQTLQAVGFKRGMTLCDIGAGTGLFTFFCRRNERQTDLRARNIRTAA